ncbi:uncharacterized protein [Leptinotarsa decemlineata]|uniref:uncharacterized protein n=1 Tax=Leptinotarsa decemlineata TaxID=7539 RepID=UPI003D305360
MEKKKAHKAYKTSKSWDDYLIFSNIRAQCKSACKVGYENYIKTVENNIASNTKYFWNFVNTKRKNNGLPETMYCDNLTYDNGNDIANAFAQQFQSVYKPDTVDEIPTFTTDKTVEMNSCAISLEIICNKLSQLDPYKGPGPDGITTMLLKNCRFTLTKPLFLLFTASLSLGEVPLVWKSSYITPIYISLETEQT